MTCLETYYISEGLFATPDQLTNAKTIRLLVLQLVDSPSNRIDMTDQLLCVTEQIAEVEHWILDIDLDFYSTLNPFVSLYGEARLYEQLRALYTCQPVPPASMERELRVAAALEIGRQRVLHLGRLQGIFNFLQVPCLVLLKFIPL